jgi:hypothetical protein
MGASILTWEREGHGPQGPSHGSSETAADVPLDYLVNALDRAVLRKRVTGTDTSDRTS